MKNKPNKAARADIAASRYEKALPEFLRVRGRSRSDLRKAASWAGLKALILDL